MAEAEAEEVPFQRWEGKARAEVKSAKPEDIWPFFEDFCGLHKWMSSLDTCYKLEGVDGRPGLVRYCAAASDDPHSLIWAKEKLLTIDPINHSFSYQIVDNNMGFTFYVATIKLLPIAGDATDTDTDTGCIIEWSFLCDPIQGPSFQDFASYIDSNLQGIAKKMEDAVIHPTA